jgi:hypothetical protein
MMNMQAVIRLTVVGCAVLSPWWTSWRLQAATMTFSPTAPTPDADDVSNFVGAELDRNNINGDGTTDGAGNDQGTYVAFDRPHQGQTFTTGPADGYSVLAVWLRHVGYMGNSPGDVGNGTYYNMPVGSDFQVRVTNPAQAGGAGFVLADETYTTTGDEPDTLPTTFTNTNDGTGTWIRFGFDAPPVVAGNTVVGFDVTSLTTPQPDGFFETQGTNMDVFAGGTAYNGDTAGVATNVFNALVGDRVFVVELAPPAPSFTLVVNKMTGAVALRNNTSEPISFDYYEIDSPDADGPGGAPGGALNPTGWNSLSDQGIDAGLAADFNNSGGVDGADLTAWRGAFGTTANADADGDGDSDGNDFLSWQRQVGGAPGEGDSWDEAGGSSNTQLVELFLNGATTLAPGEQLSLGNAFNPAVFGAGVDGNLTFRFSTPRAAGISSGVVQYVTSGPAAAVPEPAATAILWGAILSLPYALGRRRQMLPGSW